MSGRNCIAIENLGYSFLSKLRLTPFIPDNLGSPIRCKLRLTPFLADYPGGCPPLYKLSPLLTGNLASPLLSKFSCCDFSNYSLLYHHRHGDSRSVDVSLV